MKKIIFLFTLLSATLVGCSTDDNKSETIQVAVSIVPQKAFVEAVAGDLVEVVTLVPTGQSPANYQPTNQEMTKLSDADIYFSIGVPTEKANIIPNIDDFNSDIKMVKLQEIVDDEYPARYFDEGQTSRDPHIWMSPKRVVIMVETIRDELIKLDEANRTIYTNNAQTFINNLNTVDQDLSSTIGSLPNKSFIITHPSMGYFADDYGLTMVSLELDGKTATATRLEETIKYAQENNINVVFYQQEFDNSQAQTMANEIDGETMSIAPLAYDYIHNLNEVKNVFANVLE